MTRGHHRFVSARRLGQRDLLGDDRTQRAVAEGLGERGVDARELGRRGVEEGHADDRGVLVHGAAGIDRDRAAVADDDDAAVQGDDVQVLGEVHVRQHLQHDVDALAAGQPQQLVEIIRRGVIERVVGALLEHQAPALGRPRGAEHRHAPRRASCTAPMPTPPLAPCTSTVSPASPWPRWNSAWYAVAYGTFIAAPCAYETRAGNGCTWASPQSDSSAYAPLAVPPTYTRSPGFTLVTPLPTASTTPAVSEPGVYGSFGPRLSVFERR